jgi:hypothetical protein
MGGRVAGWQGGPAAACAAGQGRAGQGQGRRGAQSARQAHGACTQRLEHARASRPTRPPLCAPVCAQPGAGAGAGAGSRALTQVFDGLQLVLLRALHQHLQLRVHVLPQRGQALLDELRRGLGRVGGGAGLGAGAWLARGWQGQCASAQPRGAQQVAPGLAASLLLQGARRGCICGAGALGRLRARRRAAPAAQQARRAAACAPGLRTLNWSLTLAACW